MTFAERYLEDLRDLEGPTSPFLLTRLEEVLSNWALARAMQAEIAQTGYFVPQCHDHYLDYYDQPAPIDDPSPTTREGRAPSRPQPQRDTPDPTTRQGRAPSRPRHASRPKPRPILTRHSKRRVDSEETPPIAKGGRAKGKPPEALTATTKPSRPEATPSPRDHFPLHRHCEKSSTKQSRPATLRTLNPLIDPLYNTYERLRLATNDFEKAYARYQRRKPTPSFPEFITQLLAQDDPPEVHNDPAPALRPG